MAATAVATPEILPPPESIQPVTPDVVRASAVLNVVSPLMGEQPLPNESFEEIRPVSRDGQQMMDHDCTICAFTASCGIIKGVAEGNTGIMDRLTAVRSITGGDPEFWEKNNISPEQRVQMIEQREREIAQNRESSPQPQIPEHIQKMIEAKKQQQSSAQESKRTEAPINSSQTQRKTSPVSQEAPIVEHSTQQESVVSENVDTPHVDESIKVQSENPAFTEEVSAPEMKQTAAVESDPAPAVEKHIASSEAVTVTTQNETSRDVALNQTVNSTQERNPVNPQTSSTQIQERVTKAPVINTNENTEQVVTQSPASEAAEKPVKSATPRVDMSRTQEGVEKQPDISAQQQSEPITSDQQASVPEIPIHRTTNETPITVAPVNSDSPKPADALSQKPVDTQAANISEEPKKVISNNNAPDISTASMPSEAISKPSAPTAIPLPTEYQPTNSRNRADMPLRETTHSHTTEKTVVPPEPTFREGAIYTFEPQETSVDQTPISNQIPIAEVSMPNQTTTEDIQPEPTLDFRVTTDGDSAEVDVIDPEVGTNSSVINTNFEDNSQIFSDDLDDNLESLSEDTFVEMEETTWEDSSQVVEMENVFRFTGEETDELKTEPVDAEDVMAIFTQEENFDESQTTGINPEVMDFSEESGETFADNFEEDPMPEYFDLTMNDEFNPDLSTFDNANITDLTEDTDKLINWATSETAFTANEPTSLEDTFDVRSQTTEMEDWISYPSEFVIAQPEPETIEENMQINVEELENPFESVDITPSEMPETQNVSTVFTFEETENHNEEVVVESNVVDFFAVPFDHLTELFTVAASNEAEDTQINENVRVVEGNENETIVIQNENPEVIVKENESREELDTQVISRESEDIEPQSEIAVVLEPIQTIETVSEDLPQIIQEMFPPQQEPQIIFAIESTSKNFLESEDLVDTEEDLERNIENDNVTYELYRIDTQILMEWAVLSTEIIEFMNVFEEEETASDTEIELEEKPEVAPEELKNDTFGKYDDTVVQDVMCFTLQMMNILSRMELFIVPNSTSA